MSLKWGKRDVAKMAAVLDGEYETVEDAATAALEAAVEIAESKAKFTVVGQRKWRKGVDEPGDKIGLGWYATEKQALTDALSLAYSSVTHEEFNTWVIALHHGTPHSYYQARKKAAAEADIADRPYRERELARRVKWVADHPGGPVPKEWGVIPLEHEIQDCPFCEGVGKVASDLKEVTPSPAERPPRPHPPPSARRPDRG